MWQDTVRVSLAANVTGDVQGNDDPSKVGVRRSGRSNADDEGERSATHVVEATAIGRSYA